MSSRCRAASSQHPRTRSRPSCLAAARAISAREVSAAIRVTVATAGRTVVVSGLTIILALSSLLIFPQPFLGGMAIGGMAAVLVAMLAALTVLPAALFLLGHRIDKLRIPLPRSAHPGAGWAR